MNNLPTPLNRVELYLATAAQMPGVTPPEEPQNRLEQYLAFIAGDTSVELPAPVTLREHWLAYVAGITPAEPLKLEGAFHVGVQKVDVRFFAAAAGMPGVVAPEPQNRTEQYWARLAEILPVHGVLKYATGTNITLTDVGWWKMGLERINGDTTQNPAPSPDSPQAINTVTGEQTVEIRGKNYLKLFGASNSGVTGTPNLDGSITITGKANTTNGVRVADNGGETPYIPAGTYTFTIGKPRDSVVNLIVTTGGGNVPARITAGNTSATITTTSAAVSFGLFVAVTNGVTYNETIQLQLTAGSSADTDFQPYQNTEYKIDLGKNLFDKDNPNLLVAYIDGSHTTITANGKNRIIWIPCKANQTYTIQKYATDMVKDVAYTTVEPAIGVTVSGMVSWAANTSSITYTTGADAEYLVVRVYQSDKDAAYTVDQMLASVKIWEGGEDSAPIELCKIGTYQDYIYKNSEDWYVHESVKKTLFTGAETGWNRYASTATRHGGFYLAVPDGLSGANCVSNQFVADGSAPWEGATYSCRITDTNNAIFLTTAINVAPVSVTDWRNWLGDHNLSFYYALATPTDTKITNSALIAQLNALDRAILPKPVAYITASGDLPGELKISYYGEEE